MTTTPFKFSLNIVLFGSITFNALAQKLPNVQRAGVYAPANIKVDGRATEWSNKFQAYNHSTDIFYTLSNDDSKLYLTVQATSRAVINKIMNGGITFTVQPSGKKTDKGGASITYPLFDRKDTPALPGAMSNIGGHGDEEIVLISPDGSGKPDQSKEPGNANAMATYNKRLENAKYIAVSGIKGLDSLLSAYNTDGVKVAQLFDKNLVYTYEMAIDLKHLKLNVNAGANFAYHITLSGENKLALPTADESQPVRGGGGGFMTMADPGPAPMAATDMWGDYTLVKK